MEHWMALGMAIIVLAIIHEYFVGKEKNHDTDED